MNYDYQSNKGYFHQKYHERYMKLRSESRCVQCGGQDERTLQGYCRCTKCTQKELKQKKERKTHIPTNFERIKKMGIEELAKFLLFSVDVDEYGTTTIDGFLCFSPNDVIEWLEREVQTDDR